MLVIDRETVHERLTYDLCIPLVRKAMIALSRGETRQLLRAIIPLGGGHAFGIMPGALGEHAAFGAKLISVFPDNFEKGVQSHQGVVVLFDGESGAVVCVVHAGEVTAIRTAAASAVATDALARADASRLAILGYGEQARPTLAPSPTSAALASIEVWGRSLERADAFAGRMRGRARAAGPRPRHGRGRRRGRRHHLHGDPRRASPCCSAAGSGPARTSTWSAPARRAGRGRRRPRRRARASSPTTARGCWRRARSS